ncbi:helix-turn-helix domain-containing protein [Cupriavidus basilensis]
MLKALNRMESGRGTALQLSELTGLHRTTVRRLLETLIAEGYVRRSESGRQLSPDAAGTGPE